MKPASITFLILALTGACLVTAKERRIVLPKEEPSFPPGPGSDLFASYCLTCHSTEYISTQPTLPRKFWEATVIKMKEKFGAPIPDASVAELSDYLALHFGKP